jgi:hypothetical protein
MPTDGDAAGNQRHVDDVDDVEEVDDGDEDDDGERIEDGDVADESDVVREVVHARGHEHVSGTHASTLEVTSDDWLTPAGDCILAIDADRTPADFAPEFRDAARDPDATITCTITVDNDDETAECDAETAGNDGETAESADETTVSDGETAGKDAEPAVNDAEAAGTDAGSESTEALSATVTGRGHPDLELKSDRSMVARTSTYVDDRTIMVDADAAAADVARDLVRALADGAACRVVLAVDV